MDRPKKQKVIKQPQFTGSVQGEIIEKSQKLTEGWLERGFGKVKMMVIKMKLIRLYIMCWWSFQR